MYECPNCGGNLRFDIPTQSLFCDYCHTQLNPYSYQKDHDAVETSTYDVNIFTCPQCGGEILAGLPGKNVRTTLFLSRLPRRTARKLMAK